MSFTLNPCKACKERCKEDEGISELNSCVAETSAAFQNDFPNNDVLFNDGSAGAHWASCMKEAMDHMGRAPCNYQLNPAPVFVQAPHYFPSLLRGTGDIQQSYKQCLEYCEYNPHNKIACVNNCKTDMRAVDMISSPSPSKPAPRHAPRPAPRPAPRAIPRPTPTKVSQMPPNRPMQKEPYEVNKKQMSKNNKNIKKAIKNKPMAFWTGFTIMSLIGSFFICIIIFTLFTNKLDPKPRLPRVGGPPPMLQDGDMIVVEF